MGSSREKMGSSRKRLTSQKSISTRVMRASKRPEGSEVWIEDEELVWVLAEVVSQQNTMLSVRLKSSGETKELDLVSFSIDAIPR